MGTGGRNSATFRLIEHVANRQPGALLYAPAIVLLLSEDIRQYFLESSLKDLAVGGRCVFWRVSSPTIMVADYRPIYFRNVPITRIQRSMLFVSASVVAPCSTSTSISTHGSFCRSR